MQRQGQRQGQRQCRDKDRDKDRDKGKDKVTYGEHVEDGANHGHKQNGPQLVEE